MTTRILLLLGLIVAMPVLSAEEGARLDRQLCSICHGPGGTTSSELFPQLAGQPAPYLINQLKGFRDKSRADQNAKRFMWGITSRLTDEDIQALATFYEQQPPLHGTVTNTAESQRGAQIFTQGMVDKGVPPCMSCHGEHGEGHGEIPRLAGQHEAYLKRQLKVFYGNERPAATAMHEVVKGLSDADIEAIAQYLQAQ
jgi:cytochrome c553